MFLTATNIVFFLVSRRLVETSVVVDGDFSVVEVGRRNRNFHISLDQSTGLFVKQSKASDALSLATFKRELDCYSLAREYPSWQCLLAPVRNLDYERHSIVLDYISASESLTQYHWRIRRFSSLIAENLARALAQFHSTPVLSEMTSVQIENYPRKPIWILDFNEIPSSAKGALRQMLAFVHQHPVIGEGMQTVKREWAFDCLIHGDMKWDNCLVHPDEKQGPQLKLIDWELIDIGDAHWDSAGLLHSFFVFWIENDQRSSSMEPAQEIEELLAKDNELQAALRQSLLAFWRAYQRGVGKNENDVAELVRTLRFVAARLVLTCYEGVCNAKEMSTSMMLVLQLAGIIFDNPERMARHWFPSLMHAVSERVS